LGFAAAGIAFALQTVILALAGYFSMVAPNGIRVGDLVALQGPFGYVHGEVIDIGFVRMRLRELAGDSLRPTGRVVVFPNSVVFTGSFFKHPSPAPPADPAGARNERSRESISPAPNLPTR
jgi:small-conductance mechanosensitive channel